MTTPATEELLSLVRRAHRRVTLQLTLREALLALSAGLAGMAALLAVGTGWFPVPLLWICCLGGIAAAAYRWRRFQPTLYGIAQRLDAAWATNDQISTAYYFSGGPDDGEGVAAAQAQLAAQSAQGDLAAALPFQVPPTAVSAGGLLLLALALFGVRYGSDPHFSFQPPLAPIQLPGFAPADKKDAPATPAELARLHPKDAEESAESLTEHAESDSESARETPPAFQTSPDGDPSVQGPQDEGPPPEVDGLSTDPQEGDPLAGGESGEADGGPNEDPDSSQEADGSQMAGSKPQAESSNDLLSRLRDAFKNLLSAMNPNQRPSASEGDQASSKNSSQDAGEGGDSTPSEGEEGPQGKEGEGAEGEASSSDSAQQSAQRASQGPGDQPGSQDADSASAGTGEGSKEISEAEHLEAMGEISKLFQKRAEEMSGEVLIETESAHRQALRTPYQPTDSTHSDRGGVVGRDEVPLVYRDFIQAYFENLKKSGKD